MAKLTGILLKLFLPARLKTLRYAKSQGTHLGNMYTLYLSTLLCYCGGINDSGSVSCAVSSIFTRLSSSQCLFRNLIITATHQCDILGYLTNHHIVTNLNITLILNLLLNLKEEIRMFHIEGILACHIDP